MKVYYKIILDNKLYGKGFCGEKQFKINKNSLEKEGKTIVIISKENICNVTLDLYCELRNK